MEIVYSFFFRPKSCKRLHIVTEGLRWSQSSGGSAFVVSGALEGFTRRGPDRRPSSTGAGLDPVSYLFVVYEYLSQEGRLLREGRLSVPFLVPFPAGHGTFQILSIPLVRLLLRKILVEVGVR